MKSNQPLIVEDLLSKIMFSWQENKSGGKLRKYEMQMVEISTTMFLQISKVGKEIQMITT